MKLRNRNSDKTKKIIIIVVAAILLVAIGIGIFLIVDAHIKEQEGKKVNRINISAYPQLEYTVGSKFDPTGMKVQVITNEFSNGYFVDWNELRFEGFDSSVPNEALVMTVYYGEFSTTFTVRIFDPTVSTTVKLTSIEVKNFKTNYTLEEWNTTGFDVTGAKLICHYSDGSQQEIDLQYDEVNGYSKLDAAGTINLVIKHTEDRKQAKLTVTITVTD